MSADTFRTIAAAAEGQYVEKRSRFLAFAFPVASTEEVRALVEQHARRYYDARHVCYAYAIGPDGSQYRANDNGEPSGTAGRPILGQIRSASLTNTLIIVVRYFGGIKLGTSGLIQAYKTAAQAAIAAATIVERTVDEQLTIHFAYPQLSAVMRIIKEEEPAILAQEFDNLCSLTLSLRASAMPRLKERLAKIEGMHLDTADNPYAIGQA